MDANVLLDRVYQCTREACGATGRVDGEEFVLQVRGQRTVVIHDRHGKKGTRCEWRRDLKVVPSTAEKVEAPFAKGDRVNMRGYDALVLSCKKSKDGWYLEIAVNEDLTCPDSIEPGVPYLVAHVAGEEVTA